MGKLRNDLDFVKPDTHDPAAGKEDDKEEGQDWYMKRPPLTPGRPSRPGKKHAAPAGLLSPRPSGNLVPLIPRSTHATPEMVAVAFLQNWLSQFYNPSRDAVRDCSPPPLLPAAPPADDGEEEEGGSAERHELWTDPVTIDCGLVRGVRRGGARIFRGSAPLSKPGSQRMNTKRFGYVRITPCSSQRHPTESSLVQALRVDGAHFFVFAPPEEGWQIQRRCSSTAGAHPCDLQRCGSFSIASRISRPTLCICVESV